MQCVVIRTEDDTNGNINQFIMSIRQLIKNPSAQIQNPRIYIEASKRDVCKYNFFMRVATKHDLGGNKDVAFNNMKNLNCKCMKENFTIGISLNIISRFV